MLALITGGNRGIGAAIAYELAKHNYDLIIVGRNKRALARARENMKEVGVICEAVQCDITSKADRMELVRKVGELGRLNILVNNAGIAAYKELSKYREGEIEKIIETNLTAHILLTKELLPHLTKGAVILNIASEAGLKGHAKLSAYCASKFGMIGFTEALSKELAPKGIRVFAVCPGDTQTKMWEKLFPGIPATFLPEDVARVVWRTIARAPHLKKCVVRVRK